MRGWEMKSALSAFRVYAGQPIDDGELCVYAFDGKVRKLDWEPLPDANHVLKAERWLDEEQNDGETYVIPALRAALNEKAKDPKAQLTVVLVSDGRFHRESTQAIKAAIKAAQAKRKVKATIGVVGVHRPTVKRPSLEAAVDGGGYFTFTTEKPKPKPSK